ncbi:MAG: LicD family protein [Acutalibacteraceae bacterium]|jgi:lipopolysaccharide cholinephosphotransferase
MCDCNELERLQKKSIEILKVFKKFCEENGLLFYFCGGCCIGAVRNKGFIPWDDDIDVFMPRDDYEKLFRLWPEKMKGTKYVICRSTEQKFLRSLLTAISDEETTFIKERQKDLDISHGVRLEILPLDGCPSGKFKRKLQILWALAFQIFMNQEPPVSKGKFFEIIGRIMLCLAPTWKMRYRIAKFAERQMSKYPISECEKITELCARYQYMVNEYPKEAFAGAVYKEFEGELMPIPAGYETYLKMAFGDYMALPPEDQRVPKHDAVFIDLENSYKKYENIYYGKERDKGK